MSQRRKEPTFNQQTPVVVYDSKYSCPKPVIILCLAYGMVLGLFFAGIVAKPLYVTEDLMMGRNMGVFLSHFPAGVRLLGGIIAAVLADSYFGKFKVMASSYALVALLAGPLTIISTYHSFELKTRRIIYLVAVIVDLFVGFGSVVHPAFIAEQFKMPQQEITLETYYMFDYFYYNICVAILEFVTLEYTFEVSCFDGPKCYQILYISYYVTYGFSTLLFILMKKWYIIRMPERSVLKDAVICVWTALKNRRSMRGHPNHVQHEHWLDWADCFDQQWRDDLRRIGRIVTMLFPYFVYYFLYAQMNSMWIYQACRLDGRITEYWTMKPSQVEALNPIVIVLFAPIVQYLINPLLERCKLLHTPLQRIGFAYTLTIFAFLMAAVLQIYIDRFNSPLFVMGKAQFRVFNGLNTPIYVNSSWTEMLRIQPYSVAQAMNIEADGVVKTKLDIKFINAKWTGFVMAEEGKGTNYLLTRNGLWKLDETFDSTLTVSLRPSILLINVDNCRGEFQLKYARKYSETIDLADIPDKGTLITLKNVGEGQLYLNSKLMEEFEIGDGGTYSIIFYKVNSSMAECALKINTLIKPNSINIKWIFPQYIVITIAEIFLYVSINMFIYTQSPPSMRCVARGLFTAGNSLAQITLGAIALLRIPETIWFFSLAGVLVVSTIIHIMIARRYVYQKAHD